MVVTVEIRHRATSRMILKNDSVNSGPELPIRVFRVFRGSKPGLPRSRMRQIHVIRGNSRTGISEIVIQIANRPLTSTLHRTTFCSASTYAAFRNCGRSVLLTRLSIAERTKPATATVADRHRTPSLRVIRGVDPRRLENQRYSRMGKPGSGKLKLGFSESVK